MQKPPATYVKNEIAIKYFHLKLKIRGVKILTCLSFAQYCVCHSLIYNDHS